MADFLYYLKLGLEQAPALVYLGTVLVGLCIGSFLNVVIYRVPEMMEREWRAHCAEMSGNSPGKTEKFNLVTPHSRCGSCGTRIKPQHNIPVFSYLLLKGRCACCGIRISPQYPAVEIATALLSVWVVMQFGASLQTAAALALTWALLSLTVIDLKTFLLPDDITLPFLWLGLLLSLNGVFVGPADAILGAAAGYLVLWSVYWLFKWVTKKEGMGYGDFKLLAMLGAWMGWKALPAIILLSSFVGAAVGIAMIVFAGHKRQVPIPFGPYLAAAGFIQLLYGEALLNAYFAWLGA